MTLAHFTGHAFYGNNSRHFLSCRLFLLYSSAGFCTRHFRRQKRFLLQRLVLPAVMNFKQIQPKGIQTDGDTGKSHRRRAPHGIYGNHGIYTGRHGDKQNIISKGPE